MESGLEQTQVASATHNNLWNRAPAWRNLTVAASLLTLAAIMLPALLPVPQAPAPVARAVVLRHVAAAPASPTPMPQQLAPAPATPHHLHHAHRAVPQSEAQIPAPAAAAPSSSVCALHQPAGPLPMGYGVVIGFEDPGFSSADVARREARLGGSIDPHYLGDLRAVVRQDGGRVQSFDVPRGMSVHVGDRVTLQNSYRSAELACSYIPILITADSGPSSDQAPP